MPESISTPGVTTQVDFSEPRASPTAAQDEGSSIAPAPQMVATSSGKEDAEPAEEESPPLCARSFLIPLAVAFSGSIVLGLVIAFTPFYLIVNELDSDCSLLKGQPACESTSADCVWLAQNATCVFPNYQTVTCPETATSDQCGQLSGCVYNFLAEKCKVANGWTPAQMGIFGGFSILGAIATPTAVPPMYERIGARKTVILFSILIFIGTAITNIGHATRSFAALVVGRVTLGSAFGIGLVVAGAYPFEMIHASKQRYVGTFIAIVIPWSIAVGVALGLILEPTNLTTSDLNIDARVHGWLAIYYLVGVFYLFVAFIMDESRAYIASCEKSSMPEGVTSSTSMKSAPGDAEEKGQSPGSDDEEDHSLLAFAKNNVRALIVTVAVFALQQMTGINSISIYTPTIAKQLLGIRPLVGALIFNIYGGIFQFLGPYVARKGFNLINVSIVGALLLSVSLLVSGIAAIPGVITDSTTQGIVVGCGMLAFCGVYQSIVGPTAFQLSLRLFKPSDIPRGMAFANTWLNIWSFVCVLTFPIWVQGISGGPDKDQNKGLAATLLIYAGAALVSGIFVKLFARMYTAP